LRIHRLLTPLATHALLIPLPVLLTPLRIHTGMIPLTRHGLLTPLTSSRLLPLLPITIILHRHHGLMALFANGSALLCINLIVNNDRILTVGACQKHIFFQCSCLMHEKSNVLQHPQLHSQLRFTDFIQIFNLYHNPRYYTHFFPLFLPFNPQNKHQLLPP
jgi:hypothetical protein